jgi:hypothetical protein
MLLLSLKSHWSTVLFSVFSMLKLCTLYISLMLLWFFLKILLAFIHIKSILFFFYFTGWFSLISLLVKKKTWCLPILILTALQLNFLPTTFPLPLPKFKVVKLLLVPFLGRGSTQTQQEAAIDELLPLCTYFKIKRDQGCSGRKWNRIDRWGDREIIY